MPVEPAADEAAWAAAGLLDGLQEGGREERCALLRWLAAQGCSLEEMVAAHAVGRLFALAGDRVIRPPGSRRSVAEAAAELDATEHAVRRAWRALGLPDPGATGLDDDDLAAVRTALDVVRLMGESTGLALVRVLGAGAARLADAESSAMRGVDGIDVGRTHSELRTAQVWQAVAGFVPRVGHALDVAHRRHIDLARRHWEDVLHADGTVRSGVGFADLTGFTALSQRAPLPELAALLAAFDEKASDVVHAGGGRVVKFLGDAVMWVASSPDGMVAIAHELVHAPAARDAGLRLRAAVAAGEVVAQEGDWYGPPVNLAARLVGVAQPGQVLAAADPALRLSPAWVAVPLEPVALRGVEGPVTAYDVRAAQRS
ncbi:MAG TPA: adenylate cyclase regulatory domain-containing protein [Mycobacteriales bacterium]|nr:adenylate cyclase regulatory domain-containing protein [Mycobacteriales bacterium]